MAETDIHILLAKWLEGTISIEERKILEKQGDLTDLEASLSRLKDYDFESMDVEKLWNKLSDKRNKNKPKQKSVFPVWISIAASILLIFGAFWWWNNQGVVVIAQNGERKNIILPNKSNVVLNSGSKLKYFEDNWDKERKMELEGEAFFKVTKGVLFEVKTKKGIIRVLGTQFNVYARKNTLTVVCYRGKVEVESEQIKLNKILERGQGLIIKNGNSSPIEEMINEPLWLSGVYVFYKESLKNVFNEFERQFDVKLQINNVDLQRKFTGDFKNDNIENALKKICGAMNLNYTFLPDNKTIRIY